MTFDEAMLDDDDADERPKKSAFRSLDGNGTTIGDMRHMRSRNSTRRPTHLSEGLAQARNHFRKHHPVGYCWLGPMGRSEERRVGKEC